MDIAELIHSETASVRYPKRHQCTWPGCGKLFSMSFSSLTETSKINQLFTSSSYVRIGRPSDTARHYRIHTNDRYIAGHHHMKKKKW